MIFYIKKKSYLLIIIIINWLIFVLIICLFTQQDYIDEFNLVNIVCEFIVGARGVFSPESKEMVYKKQQNNDIIKKYFYNQYITYFTLKIYNLN